MDKEFPMGFVAEIAFTLTSLLIIFKYSDVFDEAHHFVHYENYKFFCGLRGDPIQTREVYLKCIRELGLEFYPYSNEELIRINKKILRLVEYKEKKKNEILNKILGEMLDEILYEEPDLKNSALSSSFECFIFSFT